MSSLRKIAVIGLGYVGFPVAVSFSRLGKVICYDVDKKRVAELKKGYDRTNEVSFDDVSTENLYFTAQLEELREADFFIVAVPTPIDSTRRPDLRALLSVSADLGKVLKVDDFVVYESTVYPGVTEDECVPILEAESGLIAGEHFHVGYSPERINPGDQEHRFESITKVVSGQTDWALDIVAKTYASVVKAGVFKATSIKVAEAAKVIENTQRDVNIALMNELAKIFELMEIDTKEVLEAAKTKWNFLPFEPGLVGGHCIGVDPYYLTFKAQQLGYDPRVILSGRSLNDGMGKYIAERVALGLVEVGEKVEGARVTILGLTFKENVPDLRNSLVFDIISNLESYGVELQLCDPLIKQEEIEERHRPRFKSLDGLDPAKMVVYAVPHHEFQSLGWSNLRDGALLEGTSMVLDIKGVLPKEGVPKGVKVWRL